MTITVIWLQQVTSAADIHVTVTWRSLSYDFSRSLLPSHSSMKATAMLHQQTTYIICHWSSWCSFHNNMKIVVISQQQNKSVAEVHVSVALKWRSALLTFVPALDTSTDSSISGDHSPDHSNRTRESTMSGTVYAPRIQYVLSAWTAAGSCCWLDAPVVHHTTLAFQGLVF